jgi:hypothetical protein
MNESAFQIGLNALPLVSLACGISSLNLGLTPQALCCRPALPGWLSWNFKLEFTNDKWKMINGKS